MYAALRPRPPFPATLLHAARRPLNLLLSVSSRFLSRVQAAAPCHKSLCPRSLRRPQDASLTGPFSALSAHFFQVKSNHCHSYGKTPGVGGCLPAAGRYLQTPVRKKSRGGQTKIPILAPNAGAAVAPSHWSLVGGRRSPVHWRIPTPWRIASYMTDSAPNP